MLTVRLVSEAESLRRELETVTEVSARQPEQHARPAQTHAQPQRDRGRGSQDIRGDLGRRSVAQR